MKGLCHFLDEEPKRRNSKTIIFGLIILVLIFLSALLRLKNFAASGIPTSLDTHVDCSPCVDDKPSYCAPQLPYQYKKVVWFITDGWAYYRAKSAMDFYADNSIMFTHAVIGDRWSHAVYTAWWTGLPPMNMLGFSVKGDQLWESLARAEGRRCTLGWESIENPKPEANEGGNHMYSFQYTGTLWAPIEVGGGRYRFETAYSFDEFNFVDENYEIHPFTYPTITVDDLEAALNHVASKNMSFVAHSGIFDKACHMMGKDNSQRKNFENQYLNDYFLDPRLKNFIDTHPDYLLILSSDHGAYETGISERFHGDSWTGTLGNIGYFMFYAKDLPPKPQSEIDTVDILPTLCMFLEGCDIPYHSSGVAMNYYGPNATDADYLNLYKRNLAQLQKAAKYNNLNFDYDRVDKLLQTGGESDASAIKDLVLQLKALLYDPSLLTKGNTTEKIIQISSLIVGFLLIGYMVLTGFVPLRLIFVFFPAITITAAVMKGTHIYMHLWHWGFALYVFCSFCVIFGAMLNRNRKAFLCVVLDSVIIAFLLGWSMLVSGTEVEGLAAIFSCTCFLGLGYYEYKRELNYHNKIHVAYGTLLVLFFCTKHILELYCVNGFHIFAFLIYGSVVPCMAFYVYQGHFEKSSLPLSAMLLLIRNGDLSVVLLFVLFNYVMPVLFSVALEGSQMVSGHVMDKKKLALSYLILIYVLHHNYWFFAATCTTLDWDVNPVWGAMGIDSWNRFPPLSGAFMGIGKLGLWFVSTFYILELFVNSPKRGNNTRIPDALSPFTYFLGKFVRGYMEILSEPATLVHRAKSKIDYLTIAILYSALELVFACSTLQWILSHYSPKRAWRAMACLLIIYSFQLTIWIAYALFIKKKPTKERQIEEHIVRLVEFASNSELQHHA